MKSAKYYCIPVPVFFTLNSYTEFINSILVRFTLFAPTLIFMALAIYYRKNKTKLLVFLILTIVYFVAYILFYQNVPSLQSLPGNQNLKC